MSNISKPEARKQIFLLYTLPIIPSILFLRRGDIVSAMTIVALFWSLATISVIDRSKATLINIYGKKVIKIFCDALAAIALFLTYIITVIPCGYLMKLLKRDRLALERQEKNTYWKNISNDKHDYENQF